MGECSAEQEVGPSEKGEKPVDKVRELVTKAKAAKEKTVADAESSKTEKYRELADRHDEVLAIIAIQTDSLLGVKGARSELEAVDQDLMTDELKEMLADLKFQQEQLDLELLKLSAELISIEQNPLYKEGRQKDLDEAMERHAKEQKEKQEQDTEACVDVAAAFVVTAAEWKRRIEEGRVLNTQAFEASTKFANEKGTLDSELYARVSQLPDKMRLRVEEIGRGKTRGDKEWWNQVREQLKPSVIPFLDKPLRALLAFEHDPRHAQVEALQAVSRDAAKKANDARSENITFADQKLRDWLSEGSPLTRISWEMSMQKIDPKQQQDRRNAFEVMRANLEYVKGMQNSSSDANPKNRFYDRLDFLERGYK